MEGMTKRKKERKKERGRESTSMEPTQGMASFSRRAMTLLTSVATYSSNSLSAIVNPGY